VCVCVCMAMGLQVAAPRCLKTVAGCRGMIRIWVRVGAEGKERGKGEGERRWKFNKMGKWEYSMCNSAGVTFPDVLFIYVFLRLYSFMRVR
jgi:hypothetical protein